MRILSTCRWVGSPGLCIYLAVQLCPTLYDPIDCSPPGTSVHGILQVRILEWMSCPPGDLPKPGIEPRSPALQADSLPAEPPGKPKNTGVGSLSLLQGIFQTQELNWGLLHCRWILQQLDYEGSPTMQSRQKIVGTKSRSWETSQKPTVIFKVVWIYVCDSGDGQN